MREKPNCRPRIDPMPRQPCPRAKNAPTRQRLNESWHHVQCCRFLIEINARSSRLAIIAPKEFRMPADNYVRWFRELGVNDVALVGGKNASLGELYANLSTAGVRVPNGFALTAEAYRDALTAANAWDPLRRLITKLDKRRIGL